MAGGNKDQQKGKPAQNGRKNVKGDTAATKATNGDVKSDKAQDKPQDKAPTKIEKPDHEEWQRRIDSAEEELTKANAKFNQLVEQFNVAKGTNGANQRRDDLRKKLGELREKQAKFKAERNANQDKIKKLDEHLRAKIAEQKNSRSRVTYKSIEEINQEIDRLTKQVDTGTMRLVDEKEALNKVSALHRQKKAFPALEAGQKQIDDIKGQIAQLKKGGDAPGWKEINDEYNATIAELDAIRKQNDEIFNNPGGLRVQKDQAYKEKNEKLTSVRELKAAFGQAKKAWYDHQNDIRRMRRERDAADRAAYEAGKRREVAERKLEEASAPAYQEEIVMAENVIRHFDPTALPAKETTSQGKFAAVGGRTVDTSGLKGVRVMKNEDPENYFVGGGGGGKKAKKGKKAESSKFQLSIDIIEQLAKLGVDPPSAQVFVPAVVDKLREKLDYWKKDQNRKTQENIVKAKKEIEKLEAETSPSAPANLNTGAKDTHSKPAAENLGIDGKANAEAVLKQEQDAVADAAAELEKAKLEDAAAPAEPTAA